MPWVKLDDQFSDHPKVMTAGPLAGWLYICGLTYCARYLTDGFIPAAAARKLADYSDIAITNGMAGHDVEIEELIDSLLAVGLWEQVDGGYHVHDYLDYNPTAEQIKAERAATKQRQQRYREEHPKGRDENGRYSTESNGVSNAVTNGANNALITPAPSPSLVHVLNHDDIYESSIKELHGAAAKNQPQNLPPPETESLDPPEKPKRDTTESQLMFEALADICCIDWKTASSKARGELNRIGAVFRKAGYKPPDIVAMKDWWFKNWWQGQKGQPPTPNQLRDAIGTFEAFRNGKIKQGGHHGSDKQGISGGDGKGSAEDYSNLSPELRKKLGVT